VQVCPREPEHRPAGGNEHVLAGPVALEGLLIRVERPAVDLHNEPSGPEDDVAVTDEARTVTDLRVRDPARDSRLTQQRRRFSFGHRRRTAADEAHQPGQPRRTMPSSELVHSALQLSTRGPATLESPGRQRQRSLFRQHA
jgi:hypothetical protein